MGKLQQFTITFSQPKNVFYAGQLLQGQILLQLSEPMKMRKITMLLLGRASVHKQQVTDRLYPWQHTINYDTPQEIYINHSHVVYEHVDDDSEIHPAGTHKYDFQLPLDKNLPTSYEGINGYIRYTAEATIDRLWKFNHVTKTAFTVIRQLDLNTEPASLRSNTNGTVVRDTGYCCSCLSSGPVTVNFQVNRACFVPGEAIIINAIIKNSSTKVIQGVELHFIQKLTFYGVSDTRCASCVPRPLTRTNVIVHRTGSDIQKWEVGLWDNVSFVVPPLPPSRLDGCHCIHISYAISFKVPVPGKSDIVFSEDIIIGTVPLHDVYMAAMHGAITEQPSALPGEIGPMAITNQPTAPSMGYNTELTSITAQVAQTPTHSQAADWDLAPPSYEEVTGQQVSILEGNDSKYTMGNHQYAPAYGYFTYDNPSSQSENTEYIGPCTITSSRPV